MRKAIVVLAMVLLPGPALAIDIDGKRGLSAGIATGGSQLSLIHGRDKGALILDLQFSHSRAEVEEDDPSLHEDIRILQEFSSLAVGPRLRRFGRPAERLSPYLDLFAHFLRSSIAASSTNSTAGSGLAQSLHSIGGQVGLGMGVEFETGWLGLNVAVHADFLTVQYLDTRLKINSNSNDQSQSGPFWSLEAEIQPELLARVYF